MAITYNAQVKNIVQEAFNLLRQDYTAPNVAGTPVTIDNVSDSSMEWNKAKLSLQTAANEVFDAFAWGGSYTADGISSWPSKMRNALVYTLARELSIPIAGRMEDMKAFAALANDKLTQAMVKSLNDSLESNTDPILAQIVGNFKNDDPGLVRAYSIYSKRVAAVKTQSESTVKEALGLQSLTGRAADAAVSLSVAKLAEACGLDANFVQLKMQECDKLVAAVKKDQLDNDVKTSGAMITACVNEVKAALGLDSLDAVGNACAHALCYAKHGVQYGYDANFVQLKEQEYAAKLQQAKKMTLDAALESNTDPVLTELLVNFKGDDSGLMNAFAVYTRRVANVKATAEIEVNMAHGWRTAFDWDGNGATAHPAYTAWIALCASKLAPACGFAADYANLLEQKYAARLHAAKIADLEAALGAVTDADTKDVLAMILGSFSAADAKLPRSLGSITSRIDNLKDNARRDVLMAHDWNFACVTESALGSVCEHTDSEYRYAFPYPMKALRLVAVYGHRGKLNEWKVENGDILAKEQITKIKFLKDCADVARWAPLVRPLFVMRLKALVARTVMNTAQDAAMQEQMYQQALADAKLHDAKESNTPDDAWGDNHYANRMRGRREELFRRI